MARMTLFNSPLLLGFDEIERTLDRVAKMSSDGYPPYNIEQIDEDRMRITLAVAGFSEDDLQIQREGDQLIIVGRHTPDPEGEERIFLHRGIAARQFQRRFVLAEGIEIDGASLQNGLLDIDLSRPKPDTRVETIAINAGARKQDAAKRAAKTLDVEDV